MQRARIVIAAAEGEPNAAIAKRLDVVVDTVTKWRKRFCERGLDGLVDHDRPGRPVKFLPEVHAQVKALACQIPAETGTPLSAWSAPELARKVIGDGTVETISPSTIYRWLARDALKPWQCRSWIFPRDPNFAPKAAQVLDLYSGIWEGEARFPHISVTVTS